MKGWMIQKSRGPCVNVNSVSSQTWPWKLGHGDILRQRASVPSWLRPTEDSPAGLRNSLLFRPQTDKWLGASVGWRYLDMLAGPGEKSRWIGAQTKEAWSSCPFQASSTKSLQMLGISPEAAGVWRWGAILNIRRWGREGKKPGEKYIKMLTMVISER